MSTAPSKMADNSNLEHVGQLRQHNQQQGRIAKCANHLTLTRGLRMTTSSVGATRWTLHMSGERWEARGLLSQTCV